MRFSSLLLAIFLLLAMPAWVLGPDEALADPALEARARAISRDLRCVVCQNESIDESSAELAHDLRLLVRERLSQGDSDAAVIGFIRARYGDFVLMTPPLERKTALLWLAPLLALGAGAWFLRGAFGKRGPLA